jgi:surface antigen
MIIALHRPIGRSVVALSLLALGACAEGGQKENIGTIAGAIGGAVIGAQFGSGTGRLIGVAAGTLLGGYLGREVGKSLDRADQTAAREAEQKAHTAPVGQQIAWSNPNSGNSGTVTPKREGQDAAGNPCREYETSITVDGKTERAIGTACKQPDGTWKIVE